jgi:hypothetical protein
MPRSAALENATSGEIVIIMSDAVLTGRNDGITVLTLNRPHKLDAWETGMQAFFEGRTAQLDANSGR